MTDDAQELLGSALDILWVGLFLAIGVLVMAAAWIVVRFVGVRLERRYLPSVARWSRRRAGVAEDAGPWACPSCHSVNPPTVDRCYGCAVLRPSDAPELVDAAVDPTIFHHPVPPNRFDPSLYHGPGAPPASVTEGAPDDPRPNAAGDPQPDPADDPRPDTAGSTPAATPGGPGAPPDSVSS